MKLSEKHNEQIALAFQDVFTNNSEDIYDVFVNERADIHHAIIDQSLKDEGFNEEVPKSEVELYLEFSNNAPDEVWIEIFSEEEDIENMEGEAELLSRLNDTDAIISNILQDIGNVDIAIVIESDVDELNNYYPTYDDFVGILHDTNFTRLKEDLEIDPEPIQELVNSALIDEYGSLDNAPQYYEIEVSKIELDAMADEIIFEEFMSNEDDVDSFLNYGEHDDLIISKNLIKDADIKIIEKDPEELEEQPTILYLSECIYKAFDNDDFINYLKERHPDYLLDAVNNAIADEGLETLTSLHEADDYDIDYEIIVKLDDSGIYEVADYALTTHEVPSSEFPTATDFAESVNCYNAIVTTESYALDIIIK